MICQFFRLTSISILLFLVTFEVSSQIKVLDSITKYPVSFATVSFGNGNGLFADDDGVFVFSKKLYPDIDSLFISALGFKTLKLPTANLSKTLFLVPQADQLEEVVVTANTKRKFKEEKLKPYLDDDYYKCWLPTIESEIAVYFNKTSENPQQIKEIYFPIALESKDWNKRKRSNSDKKPFSTLFKVNFYKNNDGAPGEPLTFETIVFRATEKNGDVYTLNIEEKDIYLPENGLFISIQVLGYTDKKGKLLPNKKYKEIKTGNKVVKIPTNFRPLLPFTDEMDDKRTFIRRVFINGNTWTKFDEKSSIKSTLLQKQLYNYGIGLTLKTYRD
ncbi:hypothetical protein [uncultured Winogradskyella sp.]|uniref:hypothetical protein n=1 Tax=uncultured Winogradskyella sp. TaxID=395353 RepID=UPI00351569A3